MLSARELRAPQNIFAAFCRSPCALPRLPSSPLHSLPPLSPLQAMEPRPTTYSLQKLPCPLPRVGPALPGCRRASARRDHRWFLERWSAPQARCHADFWLLTSGFHLWLPPPPSPAACGYNRDLDEMLMALVASLVVLLLLVLWALILRRSP
jgi:hypothetical protein